MAHLNALFRSLIDVGLPVAELVARANTVFTESTISGHYATLVFGKASASGEIELANAGHLPSIVFRGTEVQTLDSTGLPLGLFESSPYQVHRLSLEPGETLFLYTDGLTEAVGPTSNEYGIERVSNALGENPTLRPASLAAACLADLALFQSGSERPDDLSLLIIGRAAKS